MFRVENHEALPLVIIPRPRAGDWLEDDLRGLVAQGLSHIVCLLEPFERWQLGLDDEPAVCQRIGLRAHAFPLPDRAPPPSALSIKRLLGEVIVPALRRGEGVGFYGRVGIGRGPLMAAATLVQCGVEPEEAWQLVEAARGRPVPDNDAQRQWLFGFHQVVLAGL